MTYSDFEARWRPAGGAERANYGLFLTDLCDLLGVPRPDATTDNPAQDIYVLERAVTFDDGQVKRVRAGLTSTNAAALCWKLNRAPTRPTRPAKPNWPS